MKILSIGNSFSEDAQHYLYQLDNSITCVNLYIGGCSLEKHWFNAENDLPAYDVQINGEPTDQKSSIKEALLSEDWDFVTLQQASHDSGLLESYFPYIESLSSYVSRYALSARQIIHETWAYEIGSDHEAFPRYHNDQKEMYEALKFAYYGVAEKLQLQVIPVGDVIQLLRQEKDFDYADGGKSLCRDGYHLTLDYGRYAAAATWYEKLVGALEETDFQPPETDPALIDLIKRVVLKNVEN